MKKLLSVIFAIFLCAFLTATCFAGNVFASDLLNHFVANPQTGVDSIAAVVIIAAIAGVALIVSIIAAFFNKKR